MKQIMELIKGKGNPAPSTSINSHQFTLFCELIGELIGLLTALAPPPKRNLFLFVCCARPCSSAAMKTFFNCWRMALRGRKEINLFFFLNGALNPIKKERLTFLPLFSIISLFPAVNKQSIQLHSICWMWLKRKVMCLGREGRERSQPIK